MAILAIVMTAVMFVPITMLYFQCAWTAAMIVSTIVIICIVIILTFTLSTSVPVSVGTHTFLLLVIISIILTFIVTIRSIMFSFTFVVAAAATTGNIVYLCATVQIRRTRCSRYCYHDYHLLSTLSLLQ